MRFPFLLASFLLACTAAAAAAPPQLSRFGEGLGPSHHAGVLRLLDGAGTPRQSNAAAWDLAAPGAHESLRLTARVRVLEGGDGGSFLFLDTRSFGTRGPAPFLKSWTEPNLPGTFAIGLDVHDPPSREMFSEWGNYQDLPQREVSLHWDGRELVKRVAPAEFRGRFADLSILVQHVTGGAEVTVRLAGALVYDRWFVPGMEPYECRLAAGAGTREDATTRFDVKEVSFSQGPPAAPRRPPLHVEVFNHVLTGPRQTEFTAEVDLPPASWAFGRVLMTIDIHDAGERWDEWDRNGEVSVFADDGTKLGLVPFITSYRTPCHWVVDVTPFRPLLAGKRKLEIAAGTTFYNGRGFMMSLSLDYFHGTPDHEPFRVVPLWMGTAEHGSAANHFQDFFTPRAVTLDPETTAAQLVVSVTGHSQVGEFTPSRRTVVFAPVQGDATRERRFESELWKTDCYLNPNRPQFGTWQYSRAGWAPGDVVRPWRIDLTPHLVPGREAELRYETEGYDFSAEPEKPTPAQVAEARQVVRSYLVLSRAPRALVRGPILRILGVQEGGNAARAGVREGDWLASYDGKELASRSELTAAIEAAKAAGKARIAAVVFRGEERLELSLEPGRMGVNVADR